MLELLSFCVVEAGIPEKIFWGLTPAKLFAIIERINERIKREDYRAGIVTMLIRQAFGEKNTNPFDDFPIHKPKKKKNSGRTNAATVRQNMKAYIEAQKKLEAGE